MSRFGYEYFCGANTVVELEGMPALECAGISFDIRESKAPIYGYSSRYFDTTARGNVLVQGSFLVNYVHQDYIFRAIEMGISRAGTASIQGGDAQAFNDSIELVRETQGAEAAAKILTSEYPESRILAEAYKTAHWDNPLSLVAFSETNTYNPHDGEFPINITITFGERTVVNNYSGTTGLILHSVYIIGRGVPVRIDQEVIVEEYPFFARNLTTLKDQGGIFVQGDEITSVSSMDQVMSGIS